MQNRKRKLRCNGMRPVCSNCARPRIRGVSSQKAGSHRSECTWDKPRPVVRRDEEVEGGDGQEDPSRLKMLEDRLGKLTPICHQS
jgi:hypothetical protein